jgi:hypothetical protein
MSGPRDPDARIAAFFAASQPELPDRAFDAIRREIHGTRQLVVLGPVRMPGAPAFSWLAVTVAAVLVVAIAALDLRFGGGPGGPPNPSPSPAIGPSAASSPSPASPAGPTRFTSPLYGYSITLPAGWLSAPALLRWDGVNQPGPDAETDKFDGPDQLTMFGFAGPFEGDLPAFVGDRIAANARDHADTCPRATPDINEPLQVGDQAWALLGWNCGALIYQAVTVRAGVAFAFTFRDLAIAVADDPADRAVFLSILDSIELPSSPG